MSITLITGASGTVGRSVLAEMLRLGHSARAMYRSAADAALATPGTPTVIADFASRESLEKALRGVDALYLVCSPIPDLVKLETNVIEACLEQRVHHLVLNSALGAGDYPKSFPSWHRLVENKLIASGLSYAILRPNSFMQNILAYFAPGIRTSGAFYGAYGEARLSYLDVRDIAAVAAKALTNPQDHAGKIYELNGPQAFTCSELAALISSITGHQASYVDIPESAQRQSMVQAGMPDWQVEALIELQQYYTNGQGGEVTNVLERLLGRPPVTLRDFLQEFKDQFTPQAAGARG